MLQMGSRGPQVTKLQGDLNRLLPGEMPPLRTDGVFGMKTKDRVVKFQSKNPPLRPDGVAGPKTQTRIQQLLGPGVAPPVPGVPFVPPGPPPTGIKRFTPELQKIFQEKGKGDKFAAFLKFLDDAEANKIPGLKNFLGTIGRLEDATKLARFYVELLEICRGVPEQIPTVMAAAAKLDKDALELFDTLSKTGKLGKVMNVLGDVATKLGFIVTIIECVQHARRGDPGAVAAELYKFCMGKAVPWAAMIEGVGSLLDGTVPSQTRENSTLFKIIRSIDPIGMGAVGVDSIVSITTSGYEMAARGKVDVDILTNRLTPLVARMKQGPARLFVELGENSGDALYELCEYGVDWQAILNYSHMELKEWIESARSPSSAPVGGVRRGTI